MSALFALLLCGTAGAQTPRLVTSLDQGWRFHAGVTPDASESHFDDSGWTRGNVAYMVSYELQGNYKSVYRGEAWYCRTFAPDDAWKGKRVFLRFDGVTIVSDACRKGVMLGEHRGGFAAFTYEIPGALHPGQPNQLAVRGDDRMNPDVAPQKLSLISGGIYRHVSLIVTGPVDISSVGRA